MVIGAHLAGADTKVVNFATQHTENLDHLVANIRVENGSTREGLDNRVVAAARRWGTSPDQDRRSRTLGPFAIRPHEARLADARRSGYHDKTSTSRTRLTVKIEQPRQLAPTTNQSCMFPTRANGNDRR